LAGHLRLLGGRLERGDGAVVGYFSQDLAQELPSDATPLAHVLRVARRASPSTTEQRARSVLGALGLSGGAAKDRLIGQLSGGEKARVALAAFVLRPVNVLLLDEASNHLDVAAIDALTDALRGWDGAVVAVTHNRTFADALEPTRVARVEAGRMSLRTPAGGKLSRRDFSPDAGNTGGVAGAERSEDAGSFRDGDGGAAGVDPEEAEAAERAARDAARALEKTRREARNAPKIIEKIERALAVIDDDVGRHRRAAAGLRRGRRRGAGGAEGERRQDAEGGAVLRGVGTPRGGDGRGGGGGSRRRAVNETSERRRPGGRGSEHAPFA
jgi:ABC-type multidrug transport system ATPase subunit